jgi:hypothetical protein
MIRPAQHTIFAPVISITLPSGRRAMPRRYLTVRKGFSLISRVLPLAIIAWRHFKVVCYSVELYVCGLPKDDLVSRIGLIYYYLGINFCQTMMSNLLTCYWQMRTTDISLGYV